MSEHRHGQRGIDLALRHRVEAEFGRLMPALEAAIDEPEPATLEQLRGATDRLMRAVARVRLELEDLAASEMAGSRPGVTRHS
jgi:hypothetical protein